MKITTTTIALIFLVSLTAFSQPDIDWQKSLGGSAWDYPYSSQQTLDGGYIVAGFSESNDGDVSGNHGDNDYWVVKLTPAGAIEWQKSYGGSDGDIAYDIQQTVDGGYIVVGYSRSNDGDVTGNHGIADYWVVKLTSVGTIEWQKSYGGSSDDRAQSVKQTVDGGYIVAGFSKSNDGDVTTNFGNNDYWVLKLTATGTIEWQKSYGRALNDRAMSLEQTIDGGYIVAGVSSSNNTGSHAGDDYWILKLTESGVLDWDKSLGGNNNDWAHSISQTSDGGYIVAGESRSNDGDVTGNQGETDYWVVKLTSTGSLEWQKSLGGSFFDSAWSVQQTMDGGYIVSGFSASNDGDVIGNQGAADCWVVKLNELGAIEWQKSLGGSNEDEGFSIQQTTDGGYLIGGGSNSNDGDVTGNHGSWDFWVVKLSPVLGVDENELNRSIVLSPNPNNGQFSLDFSEEIEVTSIHVMDVLGKTIYSETNIPSGTFQIDQNFTTGVYFVKVVSATSEATLKMIVE